MKTELTCNDGTKMAVIVHPGGQIGFLMTPKTGDEPYGGIMTPMEVGELINLLGTKIGGKLFINIPE